MREVSVYTRSTKSEMCCSSTHLIAKVISVANPEQNNHPENTFFINFGLSLLLLPSNRPGSCKCSLD